MSSPTHLVSILTILFLFIDVFSHSTVSADKKLVDKVCGDDAITDHAKCLKTLSNAKAMAAKNINELVEVVMEKGAAKTKKTLNFVEEKMKKPNSPAALTALKSCAEVYRYCISEFKLVGPELKVDPMSANYDIALILPEVGKCVKALQAAKLLIPELVKGNHELYYYASLGFEMTGHLH
ncbi:hypothetical protein HRI_004084600 [Hibiscus trionum]|uniref:Serine/threonine specific protein phosphatases domain-containing protein n=1 Tax=Hibiscus trionum TaxID=183268 RepID=A0A9W7J2E3_HIBTR|nr:hypothetical protein HRI_004084600 [Hibiscus trionum]